MKIKFTVETLAYGMVVLLCLAALALIWASGPQFADVRPVYQGF